MGFSKSGEHSIQRLGFYFAVPANLDEAIQATGGFLADVRHVRQIPSDFGSNDVYYR